MFLGSRARPVHRADNLAAICEPTEWDPQHFTTLQAPRPLTEVALLLYQLRGIFRYGA
jgi:hypothetical protein